MVEDARVRCRRERLSIVENQLVEGLHFARLAQMTEQEIDETWVRARDRTTTPAARPGHPNEEDR